MTHSVEKIGGTTMSRMDELRDTLLIRKGAPYGRVFVVSAFGGITNLLLEHKKTGEAGVYAQVVAGGDWNAALDRVAQAMCSTHARTLSDPGDRAQADAFVQDRIAGTRTSLQNLTALCAHGHFHLSDHLLQVRELLAGLGEAHSAFAATLMLARAGLRARFVDLTGWQDDRDLTLDERLQQSMSGIDLARKLPVVTGYAQCREGLMRAFDRGYSEVTFARLAALTRAVEAIIHKEFHLSSADPKLVGEHAVRKLGRTSFDVADQLANLGMEAIHPKAAGELRRAGIDLRVTNAFDPTDPGTKIAAHGDAAAGVQMVTGLPVTALHLHVPDMADAAEHDRTILTVLDRHAARIVSKQMNANTITHYVQASDTALSQAHDDLRTQWPKAEVTLQPLALVALVGQGLGRIGALGRSAQALARAGIGIEAALQNPRGVDLQFLLPRAALSNATAALHSEFFAQRADELRRAA